MGWLKDTLAEVAGLLERVAEGEGPYGRVHHVGDDLLDELDRDRPYDRIRYALDDVETSLRCFAEDGVREPSVTKRDGDGKVEVLLTNGYTNVRFTIDSWIDREAGNG